MDALMSHAAQNFKTALPMLCCLVAQSPVSAHGPVAEVPPLPVGFADLTVPTTVLTPTLPQQLDMHFLATNNTLSAKPPYFIFIGETWPDAGCE